MPLSPGTRLGLYDVVGTLGVGGMGEVYRARDTRLQRDVALKILPESYSGDPERLARFEREARVLASLNHPHIGALYGVEESGGVRALVLELVEGITLADRIALGSIPLDEVVSIAEQIARALQAAHEQGIIHRDLKPANIKITPDGIVKVLDFGLARNLAPAVAHSPDASMSPTITTPAMTLAGVILGSAAYMSPEQAKGREADKRSDVWAFGCVLYEMLTGTRAFEAEDVSETLAAVLMRDPDWARLPPNLPASIQTLLKRCLERDRRKRLSDVAGALFAMDETLVSRGDPTVPRRATPIGRPRLAAVATAGVLVGASIAGLAFWIASRTTPTTTLIRFQVNAPPSNPFTPVPLLSISPDGRQLAFVTGTVTSERALWIRPLESSAAQRVPGTEGIGIMLWSPDSRSIAFTASSNALAAGGRLRKIDLRGGPVVTLAQFGFPNAWSTQGDILFRGRDGRLHRVPESGGESQPVTELDKTRSEIGHIASTFLPDGRRFLFQAQTANALDTGLYLSSLDDPARVTLLTGSSAARYAQGHLFYQRQGTLIVQPFDHAAGRLTGAAVPLVENIAYNPIAAGVAGFSVSDSGVLVYRSGGGAGGSVLTWIDSTGRPMGKIGLDGDYASFPRPSLSSDGRLLAVSRRDAQGRSDVWTIDLERDVPSRLTVDPADDDAPVFTPDGRQIVYRSNRNGQQDIYRRGSGGVGADEVVYQSDGAKRPLSFSPDGHVLLFGLAKGTGSAETWALPMKAPATPVAVVATGFPAGNAVFSPDGRWFAYCEGDSGGDQVYVQPYPQNGTRVRLSPDTGSSPQWSGDGKTVYFTRSDNHVMAVDIVTAGGELRAGPARDLFLAPGSFDHRSVLADPLRKRFLVPVPREQVTEAIDVIINWQALLKTN